MRPYSQLTLLQRYNLWPLCKTQKNQREMAEDIGVSPSTESIHHKQGAEQKEWFWQRKTDHVGQPNFDHSL